ARRLRFERSIRSCTVKSARPDSCTNSSAVARNRELRARARARAPLRRRSTARSCQVSSDSTPPLSSGWTVAPLFLAALALTGGMISILPAGVPDKHQEYHIAADNGDSRALLSVFARHRGAGLPRIVHQAVRRESVDLDLAEREKPSRADG